VYNYAEMYKIADSDVFICDNPLQGEGKWMHYYHYMSTDGSEYQIWTDADGDEKVVEL
jgi:hypothetical protein